MTKWDPETKPELLTKYSKLVPPLSGIQVRIQSKLWSPHDPKRKNKNRKLKETKAHRKREARRQLEATTALIIIPESRNCRTYNGFPLYFSSYQNGPIFPKPSDNEAGVSIYALVDPRDNTLRYVGKTVNPKRRLGGHRSPRTSNLELEAWKRRLCYDVQMYELAYVYDQDWRDAETAWIAFFRTIGKIYNITDGGD